MKNKKGNLVLSIIILTISAILLGSLFIPTVRSTVRPYTASTEYYLVANASAPGTTTLTNTNVASITSISNSTVTLTEGTNFTEADGVITFTAGKVAELNYGISYTYYNRSYDLSAGETALFGVIILGAIIGLVYAVFSLFGLVGGKN